ncbi:tRNA (adenosine(37)-N6)-threonylcarbamoyltransferase complex dimerization subunit type 1 TsaB [Marinicella litoralis]|uniref:tRNA threonylcarbamoyladenosine biosynthesis protein TsaB n=1 Tax=Marinicella litoralis TaxID=644220 RepID=A0A4R6XRJ1_9GAMM|nr:tRNA (adenosine(37)-N6)-threonylcarbamoyltransferase complex dimerization subunit type 1 TsaB [Marinicella litoralis]TDR20624.1 tRNA threonylcarbamoyladenosine biosynthesis protein TsaB [Marinicella litoralis]
MNLIAIETSTENCSVALLHQGLITHRTLLAPQKHAELVLGYLQELLDEQQLKKSDLDGIVFGQGPGAFTGVRIAMSVVQGLALALDLPVLGISTLYNMAYQVMKTHPNSRIMIANDARMGEVYWATFGSHHNEQEPTELVRLSDDALSLPEDLNCGGFDVCAGSAFKQMVKVHDGTTVADQMLPDAMTLLEIAPKRFTSEAQNIIDIKPSYIREKVVFN